jgi:hypothetical protein
MNVLLQNKSTLNYVKGLSGWTTKHEKGLSGWTTKHEKGLSGWTTKHEKGLSGWTTKHEKGLSGWTTKHEKAHVFETGLEALFFCFNRHIANMQILGEFANARMNFTFPVTDLRGG